MSTWLCCVVECEFHVPIPDGLADSNVVYVAQPPVVSVVPQDWSKPPSFQGFRDRAVERHRAFLFGKFFGYVCGGCAPKYRS